MTNQTGQVDGVRTDQINPATTFGDSAGDQQPTHGGSFGFQATPPPHTPLSTPPHHQAATTQPLSAVVSSERTYTNIPAVTPPFYSGVAAQPFPYSGMVAQPQPYPDMRSLAAAVAMILNPTPSPYYLPQPGVPASVPLSLPPPPPGQIPIQAQHISTVPIEPLRQEAHARTGKYVSKTGPAGGSRQSVFQRLGENYTRNMEDVEAERREDREVQSETRSSSHTSTAANRSRRHQAERSKGRDRSSWREGRKGRKMLVLKLMRMSKGQRRF